MPAAGAVVRVRTVRLIVLWAVRAWGITVVVKVVIVVAVVVVVIVRCAGWGSRTRRGLREHGARDSASTARTQIIAATQSCVFA